MNRPSQVEDPYPDFTDIISDRGFHGVCWMPTVMIRWVEREHPVFVRPHEEPVIETAKVLQQLWETGVVNNAGTMQNVINPGKRMWRDVEVKDEADEW